MVVMGKTKDFAIHSNFYLVVFPPYQFSTNLAHQDYFDLLEYMTHLNHVIYEEKQNFMEIVMVGVSKPEMDRHISKKFQKPEKKSDI